MTRISLVLALLAFVSANGCRMCDSPYDYCGPTFGNQCGEPCLCYERVGSVFTGPALHEYRGDVGMYGGEMYEGETVIGEDGVEQVVPEAEGEIMEPDDSGQRMAPPQRRRPNDSVRAPSRRRQA